MNSLIGTPGSNLIKDDAHIEWLREERRRLLDFYQPNVCDPEGGYNYLDATGEPLADQGKQLWTSARMLHCFSLAHMLGREGAARIVEHGLDYFLTGVGRDHKYGGWFATVGGRNPSDRKELYGQAHVLLAASSALQAGFERGRELIDAALDVINRHYWRDAEGRCVEAFDRTFTELDPYRGQNANMHLTEAFLAAYEATGDEVLLERAVRIGEHIAGDAAANEDGAWRLCEHFAEDWTPLLEYNVDDPRHPFRPYGSQPGHWLEWAKLMMQMRGLGVDVDWLLPAAANLFKGAMVEGWQPGGGFVYTVGWDGAPIVEERFFWEPAEGVGAARFLYAATGDCSYADDYRTIWQYAADHFRDLQGGSWFPELNAANEPVSITWEGKPDLYHAFQATMYAEMPAHLGIAAWAKTQQS
ncbi:AGE family epimerase/isomerase [Schaalia vaccimaxillae]|uniref:AGE family epimerase/isomerase n=1 Tax=Schaalia vaccimaxillae TaxID=183916 RepID=UPI0003B2FB67|nr:AGE family epimerase/isomerase [Schaalia vaccimaxillae]